MEKRTSDLFGTVNPRQGFDLNALFRYACSNVEGFPLNPSKFDISQFGHGQSNPTFLIEVGSRDSVKKYVLRKRPHGKMLESAHAVDREFQVLQALGVHTQVPVPKVFCLCMDPNVIGSLFYIMEFLDGRIFLDSKLPGVNAGRRREIYLESARTLAKLHSANVDAIGLGKYGRRDNYWRWAKQYVASTGEGKPDRNPKMFDLIAWLRQNIPREDSSGAMAGPVHGDFRIDNLVFHPVEVDRVIGILDWELSTFGNQMSDVAYCCMLYTVGVDHINSTVTNGLEYTGHPEGIPSQAECLAEYCSVAKPWPAAAWKFYVAFSLFRGASIYAGIHSRWLMGNASGGKRALHSGRMANGLIDSACGFLEQTSVLPEHPPSSGPVAHNYSDQEQNL
ncbi:Aminoglycoside phosphotransferase [Dillenia turbinata]|uniref:Aminoglycoside phosphotransferase n=1 Tax=Dillenia turbinata TaxID=194707 RepID=A0AAN8V886_9MAGN